MRRFQGVVLGLLFVLPVFVLSMTAQEELCVNGTLLFREDFGGNDPNDPAVGRTAVSGMSSGYQQIYKLQTSDPGVGMGSGCYLVAKRGYRNSTYSNYSAWHIMDDHTYFGDTTRGYFLEIDGKGSGNDVFYSTVIDGLCEGSRLTFSAYVANLTTAGQYNGWRSRNYVHPKLSFVLTHPETGAELARYNTDTISHDWSNYPKSWRETADWQLIGMNFTVPEGIDSVRLSIRNNASGSSTGNDFALDDIEIRLCLTPDTILTDTLVCDTISQILWRDSLYQIADTLRDTIFNSCGLDSVYYLLSVQTEYCKEPLCLDGILLFREDFGGNKPEDPKISTTPVPGMSYRQVTNDALGSMGAGNYLVTKQGYCNGNGTSQWHLQDDHTYFGDLTRGYFMEIDGRGDHSAFYSTTIEGLCEGIGLTFSAYVANVMTWGMYMGRPGVYAYPRLKFVLTNPLDNSELATYDTGDIPFDSAFIGDNMCWQQSVEWQLVGMNFTVPNGVDQIQLTIYNNTTGSNGNDFAIDDIEIHLCMTPDTVIKDTLLCDTISKIQWREKAFVMADTLRDTVFSSCGFDSIYYVLNIQTEHCEEPEPVLCTDGILLFREDFGGNDVNDPRVSSTPVPGMSYRQSTHGMGSGMYMVTKSGYCNGDTTGWTIPGADLSTKRSQWYIQDDHTYPNDYTRGYFLEIDGSGGTQQFYQTEISGLCEGIELTFSAYVANVFTWFQYDWYTKNRGPVVSPCLKFVLTNPQTGQKLAEQNTQEIPFDNNLPAKTDWQYSSAWHLVGMNFTVPVGVDAIRLSIYNNVTNGNGNDFALDDIEIHLCMTPDTVRIDTLVCDTLPQITWREKSFTMADTLRDTLRSSCGFDSIYYLMRVETEQCCRSNGMHGFSVSADRQVLFAPGNLQYNAGKGSHLCADGTTQQGVWRFAEHQWDYIGKANENASATYNGWIDLFGWGTSGWDGGAKAYQPWSTSTKRQDYIEAIPHDMTGEYRYRDWAVYNTIGDDAPETWRTLTKKELHFLLYYRDNAAELYGMATIHDTVGLVLLPDDFSFSSVLPEFKAAKDLNNGTNVYTVEQWKQLEVEGAVFLPCVGQRTGMVYESMPTEFYWSATQEYEGNSGACCLLISVYNTQIGSAHLYYGFPVRPVFDIPEYYLPTLKIDTTVCDTLLPLTWRGHEWTEVDVIRDTLQSVCGTDSICLILSLNTEICCPNVIVQNYDTVVCDTLMPYRWCDTLFTESATFEIICKDNRGCDSLLYILHLDTIHCERLYDIIVNKYNWQLLCNNVRVRELFPQQAVAGYQWYKDGTAIPNATEDDYSEQNELQGEFQLRLHMSDGRYVWSEILTIQPGQTQVPSHIRIYNHNGYLFYQSEKETTIPSLPRGLYIIQIEQNGEQRIEKKLIP